MWSKRHGGCRKGAHSQHKELNVTVKKIRFPDSNLARRHFNAGPDAPIIMGDDEEALLRLWREKRGEVEPKDLSGNLTVKLGAVTERT